MPQSFKFDLTQPPAPVRTASPPKRTASPVDQIVFGSGILIPFRQDEKGDFANAASVELVRAEIRQVLGTLAISPNTNGELPWRPEFGSLMELLRFRNLDETTVELARVYVVDALRVWLTRIRVKEASVVLDYDANTLFLRVRYDLLSQNRRSVAAANVQDVVDIPLAA